MANEFLTQDEVDTLLQGVTGEAGAAAEKNDDGVRPYNLATQERIVRGRMPTLEMINERFVRLLRVGLFNFMGRSAEISVGALRVQKYAEFIRNLVVPTNLNLVQAKPLRGTALFVFDPTLVFLVVDNLFGSDGRFHARVEGREFTQTEQRIIQRVLEIVFEHYEKSWQPIYPLKFEYLRAEVHTQFANIATPNEVVIAATFTVEMGPATGDFHICLPYAMVEPIRDILYSSLQGDRMEADKRWVRLLKRQVQSAEIELVANLGQAQLSLAQVMQLGAGDVIPIDIPEHVVATVDGVPVMECQYGAFNGQFALRVHRMISHARDEAAAGDETRA